MSESGKDKPASTGQPRPAHPQATWPTVPPNAIPAEFQWQQQMYWPWQVGINPYQQQMYIHQQQIAAAAAAAAPGAQANSTAPSPRNKDDSVKVVKPKDALVRGIHSPAGIQSPKPNSPGFLLGAGTSMGGRAFSVYTSRSDTPGQAQVETGVDLSKSSSSKKSGKAKSASATAPAAAVSEKDKKDERPVGVAVARQRSAADSLQDKSEAITTVSPSSTTTAPNTAVTTTTSTTQASVHTTVNNQWPTYPAPMPHYMPSPYQHFAMAPQGAMYMMPAHRPMFPAQPGVGPPHGYIPVPAQQVMIPELTVKTSQAQVKAHASTSPNKPVSAASSPKSPLDKAREKMHQINQRKGCSSSQPSPSNSETKSVSSESTEKTAEGGEAKPYQKSVIMTNTRAISSPEHVTLKPPPAKREKKDRQNSGYTGSSKAKHNNAKSGSNKNNTKASSTSNATSTDTPKPTTPEKGPRLKARRSGAISPSAAAAAVSDLETLPEKPKPLIAPAKFKPETTLKPETLPSPTFSEPLSPLKRSISQDKPKPRRSRSKDSVELSGFKSTTAGVERRTSSRVAATPDVPKTVQSAHEEKTKTVRGKAEPAQLPSMEIIKDEKVSSKTAAVSKPKQTRARGQKRKSTDSTSKTESGTSAPVPLPIPVNVEEKEFLFKEDAFDPVIVKHNQQVYDICQDEDLKQLETKLKSRLKALNKQIQTHQNYLKGDSSAAFPLLLSSISANESRDAPLSPDKLRSSFSVRSDSHPSLKMKAAAKAKSRASQDEREAEKEVVKPPVTVKSTATSTRSRSPAKSRSKQKFMTPLAPIAIPEKEDECKRLTKDEIRTVDSIILTCIEGLFYESRIRPIEPPDIYGVVIDGERHSKPRIFTEEDLLKSTFTNSTPTHLNQLDIGSRVCAIWSDMISCLYPGRVTAIYPATTKNSKDLLDIEFDDGDSGKFPLIQIRFLPNDLEHITYDASNVIPVSRRRRSCLPETPPIMTTPPNNRNRCSTSSLTSANAKEVPMPKKRGRPEKEKSTPKAKKPSPEPEVFEDSTEDEDFLEGEDEMADRWEWLGDCTKKPTRGRGVRYEYHSVSRPGDDVVSVGHCVVIKPMKKSATPYIAEVQSMFGKPNGDMYVTVKWFYHPEDLKVKGVPLPKHKGALFRTEHGDTIGIQSIKHKCEVLSQESYVKKKLHLRSAAERKKYDDYFYIAGIYDAGNKVVTTRYYT